MESALRFTSYKVKNSFFEPVGSIVGCPLSCRSEVRNVCLPGRDRPQRVYSVEKLDVEMIFRRR
jgi:hypothetical protein